MCSDGEPTQVSRIILADWTSSQTCVGVVISTTLRLAVSLLIGWDKMDLYRSSALPSTWGIITGVIEPPCRGSFIVCDGHLQLNVIVSIGIDIP